MPDVSANADPNSGYVLNANQSSSGGGWTTANGTSAAAPMWAAYTALVNAQCQGRPVGFANPLLYQIASENYANTFNDITNPSPSGYANNDAVGTNGGLYPVTAGYDMTTGLGSMQGPELAAALCVAAQRTYSVNVTSPGNQQSTVGSPVSLPVTASDSGHANLTYSATGLPAGLSISPTTGVISGTPSTAQTTNPTVSATDAYGNAGSTSFEWTIANPTPPAPQAPSVSIARPANRARYRRGQVVAASYGCQEGRGGPGLAACVGTTAKGRAIDTATLGQHRFTVTATSTDGRHASQTVSYTVVLPNNRFTITHVRTQRNGAVSFVLTLPGAGTTDVLETAWLDNFARAAALLQPAPRRFVFARAHRRVTRPRAIRVTVTPNPRGRRLVNLHRYALRIRLWVSYTPTGGTQRNLGRYGLYITHTATHRR